MASVYDPPFLQSASTSRSRLESSPPLTACLRCREQKLRCTRELPVCARCSRQKTTCHYPPPPDRKSLALLRTSRSGKRRRGTQLDDSHNSNLDGNASKGDQRPVVRAWSIAENRNVQWSASVDQNAGQLPPRSLSLVLLDIFFSRNTAAAIAFHEGKLFQEFLSDDIPHYVLRAIFALTSIFLHSSNSSYKFVQDDEIKEYKTAIRKRSDTWANLASHHVLARVDCPSLRTAQTCATLSLYWYAVGQLDRAKIHARLAYTSARILGYHSRLKNPVMGNPALALQEEIRRRCFWACWIINCLIPGDDSFTGSHISDVVDVPLPVSEISFQRQYITVTQKIDNAWNCVNISETGVNDPSILGEIIKILGIYSEIQKFLARMQELPTHQQLGNIFDLHRRATDFYRGIPPPFTYKGSFKEFESHSVGKIFFLYCAYHHCVISLHMLLVPLFSGEPSNESVPPEFVHTSAQIVIQHADSFADMVDDLLSLSSDLSPLPPFVGFCSFKVASVHAILLRLEHDAVPFCMKNRLLANMVIVDELREYWVHLNRLWEKLFSSLTPAVSLEEIRERRHVVARNVYPQSGNSVLNASESLKPYPYYGDICRYQYIQPDGAEYSEPHSQPQLKSSERDREQGTLVPEALLPHISSRASESPSYDDTEERPFEDIASLVLQEEFLPSISSGLDSEFLSFSEDLSARGAFDASCPDGIGWSSLA